MMPADQRLRHILGLHFDPDHGAPYWLDRRHELTFDPRTDIATVADLVQFGPMPQEALAERPVDDFIPRSLHGRIPECVTSETGGTTGPPKRTAYFPEEFAEAFVTPFVRAAELVAFPRNLNWLYIGPTGPHIIGKGARACAAAMGSIDPFTVDFDPRWARKMPEGSMARRRYLEHVLEQAEAVLATQHVGVLFGTPPVLEPLGERVPLEIRRRVLGVHLGGLPSSSAFLENLATRWFPNAVVMGGYGNSLAGVCPEVELRPAQPPEYFPYGTRLILDVDAPSPGTRGPVRFHRLDESAFLPNVIERDEAETVTPSEHAYGQGFTLSGLRDPKPAPAAEKHAAEGLY